MVFGPWDWFVFIAYFVAVQGIGYWAGRKERDTKDYFLGGRRQHWFLAGVSIIATEVSALTIVGVPGDACRGDWTYLQLYAGAFLGRWLIVFLLLPAFYGGSVTTVYEYLGQRFGPRTQTTAALCFTISRVVGSGIRLLAGSMAVAVVFDWSLPLVLLGTLILTTAYTMHGGIKAILWTDLVQALVFVGGGVAALVVLFHQVPGSWRENIQTAWDAGKLHTFNFRPGSGVPQDKLFWLLLVSTTLTNMAALGTDQDLTQRMLTCKDVRESQRSLIFNLFAAFPVVCLFLSLGTLLFLYFAHSGGLAPGTKSEQIFPTYIARGLPFNTGLRGLLVTAIFAAAMSSAASTLGALSSSAVTDLYRPLMARLGVVRTERHYLRVARGMVFVFALVLALIALGFSLTSEALLWEALKWPGLVFGAMLGAFLLGVLTKTRGNDRANLWIMLGSVGLLAWIRLGQFLRSAAGGDIANTPAWWEPLFPLWLDRIAWPWWIIIGTTWTFGLGALFSTPGTGRSMPVVEAGSVVIGPAVTAELRHIQRR